MKRLLLTISIATLGLIACDKQATADNGSAVNVAQTQAASTVKSSAETAANSPAAEPSAAQPLGPQAYVDGVHYQTIDNPVEKHTPNKDEVVEVFWYGCIHCFNFEPMVQTWKANKPDAVEFVAIPAIWNERLALHAKMYYSAKALGVFDDMHMKIFRAMNQQRKAFATTEEIADFFVANGVERKTFLETFNSFGIASKAAAAGSKTAAYGVEGTPEVIVNGKYRTSARMAQGQENIFKVVEYLLSLD